MVTIDEVVKAANQEWRTLGVARRDRVALAADLRLDLDAAAADEVSAEQLLDGDVRGFARRLAEEAAVRRVPGRYGQVLATGLSGAVVGALLGGLTVYVIHKVLVALFDLPRGIHVPVALAVAIYFGGVALITIGGAVAGVRILLRRLPGIGRTAAAMSLLLTVGGAVMIPLVVAFARWTGYSDSFPVVLTEIALSITAFAGVTALARHWSLRRHQAS